MRRYCVLTGEGDAQELSVAVNRTLAGKADPRIEGGVTAASGGDGIIWLYQAVSWEDERT